MKLVFLSNYYTHHQKPVCEEWNRLTAGDFLFVSTEDFPEERKKLGWKAENPDFLTDYCDQAVQNIESADAVILGNAPLDAVKRRLKQGKTVFKYSERVFKSGYSIAKWIPRLYTYYHAYGRHRNLYLLAASAYVTADFAMHGTFVGKSYKWGYFPQTRYYNTEQLFDKKDPLRILWCGRFVSWKHPEAALDVAKKLKKDGFSFCLDFIGDGELLDEVKHQTKTGGLSNCVRFLGAMSPDQVREHMENAGVYLFTSDFNEGWGAVLNEAMNSGCAVVASHAMGATPFLLNHGKNGLIYENGNMNDLYLKIKALLLRPEKQRELGEHAYYTITKLWNADVAAKRFVQFMEEIEKQGFCDLFQDGPCSRAPVMKNNWFKEDNYDISWIKNSMG